MVSPHLLTELDDVLHRERFRSRATVEEVDSYLGDLRVTSEVVPDAPQPLPAVTRDPKDDYLVALAQSASGDALISGDPHLTELTDLVLDDRSVFGKSSKGLLCFYIPPHS